MRDNITIRIDEPPSKDSIHSEKSKNARSALFPKLLLVYRGVRNFLVRRCLRNKHARKVPDPSAPRMSHPFLQPAIPPALHLILLLLYDGFLIVVLISHNYAFRNQIGRSDDFCNTDAVVSYPDSILPPVNETYAAIGSRVPSMKERCQRYNWNIIAAGGFSSAVAAILTAIHLAAIISRLAEPCYLLVTITKHKKTEDSAAHLQGDETEWRAPPRDIEIHNRGTATSDRTGRLTAISEEEHNAEGQAARRRRTNKSRSRGSGTSMANAEDYMEVLEMLLECMV